MSLDIRAPDPGASLFSFALAILAAAALVVASAGFGGYFAWSSNQHHAPILACFAVLMALGLEVAKPLAVHGVFSALKNWRLGQAGALAIVATVAVGYSLVAELQLMARARSDAIAERHTTVKPSPRPAIGCSAFGWIAPRHKE